MRTVAALTSIFCLMPLIAGAHSSHYVRPHITKDGRYVEGHQQTNPDGNRFNNWSTQGNYNPYTGQAGTVNPYSQPAPQSRQGYVSPYSTQQCGYNSRGQYVCR